MAGAILTTAGIGDRPQYAYSPPEDFFGSGTPTGPDVFNVTDFGAIADPAIDNRPMIQAAIDAANAAGGGIVYIPAGIWGIAGHASDEGAIQLKSNVFLKGAGQGETVLRLVDGSSEDITGLVRTQWGVETSNAGLADLTIDGNRINTTGQVDGFFTGPVPGQPISDKDIYALRVEIENVSRYGFDPHETTERLSIRDSLAHDNAVDGFVLDRIVGGEFVGNASHDNGRHGFNVVTSSENLLFSDNESFGNGGAGIVIQRGSENIGAPQAIVVQGGSIHDNGREGVLIQGAENIVIDGVDIHGNGMSGVRLYGASNVTVTSNTIHDNSQTGHDIYSEVSIQSWNDTTYGQVYEAQNNLVDHNAISSTGLVQSRYGIEERAGDTGNNIVSDNTFAGTTRGPMALNGQDSYALKLGTEEADVLVGSATHDKVEGLAGNDSLSGQDGNDQLLGGDGSDQLLGGKGRDVLDGGSGDDTLNGNSDNDTLMGGDGADTLIGDAGNDWLEGGGGNDIVSGGSGNDTLVAGAGSDKYDGGAGFDTLDFSDMTEAVSVDLSLRKAVTTAGTDTVSGIEQVLGTANADSLTGDKNANTLSGGDGADVLRGMGGADTLTGGAGDDIFTWTRKDVVDSGVYLGRDTITDLEAGDALDLRGLLAGRTYGSLDEVVTVTSGTAGTTLSIDIAGVDYELAFLAGVQAVSAATLLEDGLLLA